MKTKIISYTPHESQLNLRDKVLQVTQHSSSSSVMFAHFKQQVCHPLLNGAKVSHCLYSFRLVPPHILWILFITSLWFLRNSSLNSVPTCKLFLYYLVTNSNLKVYVVLNETRLMVYDFTFECCILLRIYLTYSLWRRQSQQSFNTLTPFNFLCYSLHVSASTGHPQVRYTISYYFCFWRTISIQRIRCTYAIWL
jgi:hypothetical protein